MTNFNNNNAGTNEIAVDHLSVENYGKYVTIDDFNLVYFNEFRNEIKPMSKVTFHLKLPTSTSVKQKLETFRDVFIQAWNMRICD